MLEGNPSTLLTLRFIKELAEAIAKAIGNSMSVSIILFRKDEYETTIMAGDADFEDVRDAMQFMIDNRDTIDLDTKRQVEGGKN